MPTLTTNYSLEKPLVNSPVDEDLWGGELNDDLDLVDTLLRAGITIASQSSQTTGFTADASISVKKLYPCDATAGAFNATIPAAATAGNGATIFFKKTDSSANAITLVRSGADTLDGATSLSLSQQNSYYGLVSDGVSAWNSISSLTTVSFASAAETLAGTDATKAITPAGFAGNKSLASNGYYKLPGGLIYQWGSQAATFDQSFYTVSYPTAFTSACYSIYVQVGASSAFDGNVATIVKNVGTTSFDFAGDYSNIGGSGTIYWFAVGK